MAEKLYLRAQVPQSIRKLLPRKDPKIPVLTADILRLEKKLRLFLKHAWPDAKPKDISYLSTDLAALWEVSRLHIILVRNMLKMRTKLKRRELQGLSQELDVNWFSNASGHMKSMKGELARFKSSLYSSNRNPSKRRATDRL